jgi:hypothetical protein
VVLKRMQMIFISKCVAAGEGFSRLGNLSSGPLLFLFDMLLATRECSRT